MALSPLGEVQSLSLRFRFFLAGLAVAESTVEAGGGASWVYIWVWNVGV